VRAKNNKMEKSKNKQHHYNILKPMYLISAQTATAVAAVASDSKLISKRRRTNIM
jgi:hypothetical protein